MGILTCMEISMNFLVMVYLPFDNAMWDKGYRKRRQREDTGGVWDVNVILNKKS